MNKRIVIIGVVLIVTAIILGAFGAHALKEILSDTKLKSFETGVRYQMYHGLAFLILGLNEKRFSFSMNYVYIFTLMGIVFFSASIYGLAMQEVVNVSLKFLGPITPVGGLMLIIGWILFMVKLIKQKENETF